MMYKQIAWLRPRQPPTIGGIRPVQQANDANHRCEFAHKTHWSIMHAHTVGKQNGLQEEQRAQSQLRPATKLFLLLNLFTPRTSGPWVLEASSFVLVWGKGLSFPVRRDKPMVPLHHTTLTPPRACEYNLLSPGLFRTRETFIHFNFIIYFLGLFLTRILCNTQYLGSASSCESFLSHVRSSITYRRFFNYKIRQRARQRACCRQRARSELASERR